MCPFSIDHCRWISFLHIVRLYNFDFLRVYFSLWWWNYFLHIVRFKTLAKRFTIMALDKKQEKEISRQKYLTAGALVLMFVVIVITYIMVA